MSQVLVLVDHVDGVRPQDHVRAADDRPPARRAGRRASSAAASDTAAPALAEYGAATAYVVESDEADDYLVVPKVEALQAVLAAAGAATSPPC